MKIKFMLFPLERVKKLNRRFLWIGNKLEVLFYNVKYDLIDSDIDAEIHEYLTASFISASIYSAIGFILGLLLTFAKRSEDFSLPFLLASIFFAVFFILHIIYPRIMAKQRITEVDDSLTSALNNVMVQLSSGITLYDAMANVSKSGYGVVSKEFEKIIEDINTGAGEIKAIEKAALRAKSEYFRKTLWQIITSMRSGASLYSSLNSVVESLNRNDARAIRNYAGELNLWILVYLLGAAAIPSLGISFMVMLSALGGAGIDESALVGIAAGSLLFQIFMIGFVRTRIPKVFAE